MAVSRREKNSDSNYVSAIGSRPSENKEPDLLDVIEDLRDDMNSMCDLSATNEAKVGLTSAQTSLLTTLSAFGFTYTASPDGGRTPASLTIRHLASRTDFTIDA